MLMLIESNSPPLRPSCISSSIESSLTSPNGPTSSNLPLPHHVALSPASPLDTAVIISTLHLPVATPFQKVNKLTLNPKFSTNARNKPAHTTTGPIGASKSVPLLVLISLLLHV